MHRILIDEKGSGKKSGPGAESMENSEIPEFARTHWTRSDKNDMMRSCRL